jgi:hypothetical protein
MNHALRWTFFRDQLVQAFEATLSEMEAFYGIALIVYDKEV